MKWIEIDQDYLRTGTAISSRASHEHSSDFLFLSTQTSCATTCTKCCTTWCRGKEKYTSMVYL